MQVDNERPNMSMRRSFTLIASLLLLLGLVAGSAHAHGPGADSSACSDGYVPGDGAETGDTIPYVGIQAGQDNVSNYHTAYLDVCADYTGPTISIVGFEVGTGKVIGFYASARILEQADPCDEPVQFIINDDGDALISTPEMNNC